MDRLTEKRQGQYWDYPVVEAYAGVDGVWIDTWHLRLAYTPTHWMPLPEPPEEDT